MQTHFENHLQKFLQTDNLSSITDETLEKLRLPQFTISDIGITHRWVTHWHDQGLLIADKPKGRWRTFNIVEFIWLRMIVKLRSIGVNLENIKVLKDALGSTINWLEFVKDESVKEVARKTLESEGILNVSDEMFDQALSELNQHSFFKINSWLELLTLDLLISKEPIAIVFTSSGKVIPHRWNYPVPELKQDSVLNGFLEHSFISISLNDLAAELIGRQTKTVHKQLPDLFSQSEWRVLLEIHEGNAKELKIKFKDGEIQLLEITQDIILDSSIRLSEVLMNNGYQELELKTAKGEVVTAQITDKIKY